MPQFSYHAPVSQGDMAEARRKARAVKLSSAPEKPLLAKQSLPVGVIGESANFSWGYNGKCYYVAEGVFEHLVSPVYMTLEEAKRLFESLVFVEACEPSQKLISQAIKASRKGTYVGDELMWFFVEALSVSK